MRDLVDKLVAFERNISNEKGGFSLFALFLREDAPNKWDLVAASSWFQAQDKGALDYIAKELQSRLTPEELLSLSRIVLLDQDNPSLEAIHKVLSVEHGIAEVIDSTFFGMQMKHAYIITSKRSPASTGAETR